jgi:hypothetical protein
VKLSLSESTPGKLKRLLDCSGNRTCDLWFASPIRLLARRASRRPGTPLERKMDAFGSPNSGGKGKLFPIISVSVLIHPKRNSFNSHYYYTFDILINLMVYLAQTSSNELGTDTDMK